MFCNNRSISAFNNFPIGDETTIIVDFPLLSTKFNNFPIGDEILQRVGDNSQSLFNNFPIGDETNLLFDSTDIPF